MFYKLLVFVLILINSKCFCDSSQQNQNLDLNNSDSNQSSSNEKSIETNGDLQETNGTTNQTTVNKTSVDTLAINDLPVVPTPSPPNEMLSFEEWRKKIAEKSVNLEPPSPKITSQLTPQSHQSVPTIVQSSSSSSAAAKQKPIAKRTRNFASYECGAKVVDSNPESESVQRILNEQTDEYMLNPCKANIWFVIELCETIQPKTIEIANFELYSSVPKEFSVEASDHYPTREWSRLGNYNASEERSDQRFQLQNNGFVKFVKIEMLSHYGSEHFCPLSVVRVFGTSLFEEVERIDNLDTNQNIADEDESPLNEELVGEADSTQNILVSAKDAVYNIVRKAAQALNGNSNEVPENSSNGTDSPLKSLNHLESVAIDLFPKVDKYLINCTKLTNYSFNCCYLKSLFGQTLYELLIDHSFNCYVSNSTSNHTQVECTAQPKNNTNESIRIESSLESQNFDVISPTKAIFSEVDSKSEENISVNSVSVISDDLRSGVTQTLTEEQISTATDSALVLTIVSESIHTTDKSEDMSSQASVPQKDASVENENIVKNDDLLKNVINDTNETNVKTNQMPAQQQNGDSNGYPASGPAIGHSKESVVIRLTNRIKTLEVNLSLSSQYLEELSQRYRKQMEEMQRAFNITISKLNDTNIRAAERDLKQQESIGSLESKLNALNTQMSVLLAERENLNWHYIEVHIALMMIEVIVVIVFLLICVNRLSQRINFLQINDSFKEQSLKSAQNSVSPNKRSHPDSNPYPIPHKTLRIEGEDKQMDSNVKTNPNPNNKVNPNSRKIRKKKKKTNCFNGNQLSNSLESETFVLTANQTNVLNSDSTVSLISKSQSTPLLAIKSQSQQPPNGQPLGLSDKSCHSSTSGLSSNTNIVSNVLTKQTNNEIKVINNKKSLNDNKNRKFSSDTKSISLTHSLKKLLKFERK